LRRHLDPLRNEHLRASAALGHAQYVGAFIAGIEPEEQPVLVISETLIQLLPVGARKDLLVLP